MNKTVSFVLRAIFGTQPKRQTSADVTSVPRRERVERRPVSQKLADLSTRAARKGTR